MHKKEFLFIFISLITLLLVMVFYMWLHEFPLDFRSQKEEWKFDFILKQNIAVVGFEIFIWVFTGVTCRLLSTLRKEKEWNLLAKINEWLCESVYTWGAVLCFFALFNLFSINIGSVPIDLRERNIETVIGLSFVFGFFNDQTLDLFKEVIAKIGIKKNPNVSQE